MTRSLAAAVLGVLLYAACTAAVPEFSDPAQVIEVANGTEFELVLVSNQSTGFQWVLTDSAALGPLNLLRADYRSDHPDRNGASGKERWRFRANGTGEGVVTLVYKRPWETGAPIETKQFRVRVK